MNSDEVTLNTTVVRNDAVLSSDLGGDIVMMDIERGAYYGLEAVAARIWELTEKPAAVSALCERLVTEYKVSVEQCRQEVLAFVADLLNHDILQIVPGVRT